MFAADHRLRWSDEDDLENTARLAWWRQRSNFNPDGGASRETYLKLVARHAMEDLLKAEEAVGRHAAVKARPLQEVVDGSGLTLEEMLADEADPIGEWNTEHDLETVELTPRQRAVIRGVLDGYSLTELARNLGINRDTLYEDRRRIQRVFRENGLYRSDR